MKTVSEFPRHGTAVHTCKNCKQRTRYNGVLYIAEIRESEKKIRVIQHSVRNCPSCGANVVPV